MVKLGKVLKLGKSFVTSQFHPLPIWVHLWVTDSCNLTCDYCEVTEENAWGNNPSTKTVKEWIAHADSLGSAIVAFMGGEPTLRSDLADLIAYASERRMLTYVTSHGQLKALGEDKLRALGEAGLDTIEVSLDGYDTVSGSIKTLRGDESLIDRLQEAKKRHGIRYKTHQVLAPENLDETPKLVDLAERRRVPMTFGLVTEVRAFHGGPRTVYEDPDVKKRVLDTLDYLIDRKRAGVPIINTEEYFRQAKAFVEGPLRWECDVGSYMIQVATSGEVFQCSKLAKETTGRRFLDLDRDYFIYDDHGSTVMLEECNDKCYSACMVTTTDMRRHPLEFVRVAAVTSGLRRLF